MLEVFRRSPVEYAARFVTQELPQPEPSEAMILGTALHTQLLEPERWDEEIIVAPKVDRRTKDGKAAHAEFSERANGRTVITEEQDAAVKSMTKSLLAHPEIAALLRMSEYRERSLRWECDMTLLLLKCRPDVICKAPIIVDIKTARDVSPEGFARQAVNFGYHRQAAFYCRIVDELRGKRHRFVFAVVQSSPPWEAACYRLPTDAMDLGYQQNLRLVEDVAACSESGEFIAPQNYGIAELTLPKWAFYQE
jgi:exodeoxyribonuclease VIII